uniref:Uncharacterized protein n=1 Tax=Megaselia scalaris TaxID=36166 RepID=T1H2H6_MEGSC
NQFPTNGIIESFSYPQKGENCENNVFVVELIPDNRGSMNWKNQYSNVFLNGTYKPSQTLLRIYQV